MEFEHFAMNKCITNCCGGKQLSQMKSRKMVIVVHGAESKVDDSLYDPEETNLLFFTYVLSCSRFFVQIM